MSLYKRWNELVESHQTQNDVKSFWKHYFDKEKDNYAAILSEGLWVLEGSVKDLADRFNMDPVMFTGFLDGINTSLTTQLNIDELEEDTNITLTIEPEKLYFNMLDAKADWLYNLPQWDGVLSAERRREINQEYRASKMARSTKIGRNEPCPCGSGKKYKKCCGA
ncbi:MAG TPA: SEC-C domain-containing protein [Clostridiales bacterium]|nr:SEC-C domain-containing protein [Clostridiales bacterium]